MKNNIYKEQQGKQSMIIIHTKTKPTIRVIGNSHGVSLYYSKLLNFQISNLKSPLPFINFLLNQEWLTKNAVPYGT